MEAETKKMNHSWGTIQRLASDRQGWRSFVAALYATGVTGGDDDGKMFVWCLVCWESVCVNISF